MYKKDDGVAADWNFDSGFAYSHEGIWSDNSATNPFQIEAPAADNTWYLDVIDMGSQKGSFWRNGALVGTDDYSMTTVINADTFRISQGSDGISNGNNLICEILLYNKKLTVAERLAIQDYLHEKWTRTPTKPETPEYVTLAAFDGEILSRWLPGGGNESGYLLVRSEAAPVSWAPTNGTAYTTFAIDEKQTVVYVGADTSYIDTNMTGDQNYYYALYAHDSANNYSTGSMRQTTLLDISGLAVRFEGSSLTGVAGDKIAIWPDSAGGNDATQENQDKRPTLQDCANSFRCVYFDGIDDELTLGNLCSQFSTDASFYIVAWPYNDPHYNLFYTSNPGDTWWRYHGNGYGYPGMFRNKRIENYGSIVMPSNGPALWAGHSNAMSWQMWVSGRDLGSAAAAYSAGDNYGIGGPDNANSDKFLNGVIYEIILFNKTLSADEKTFMDDYIREKYGLKLAGAWW